MKAKKKKCLYSNWGAFAYRFFTEEEKENKKDATLWVTLILVKMRRFVAVVVNHVAFFFNPSYGTMKTDEQLKLIATFISGGGFETRTVT